MAASVAFTSLACGPHPPFIAAAPRCSEYTVRCSSDLATASAMSMGNELKPCAFCTLPVGRVIASNDLALAVRDAYPISPGHTLVIPRRHVGSFFEVTAEERAALLALLDSAKLQLDSEMKPDGYNIGINDGAAAGQTVAHLHIHLIPRYAGDQQDPRGGVRWIVPDKARYWP